MRKGEVLWVRIPPDLMVELDDIAEKNGLSRSAMAMILLSMAIGHVEKAGHENLAT